MKLIPFSLATVKLLLSGTQRIRMIVPHQRIAAKSVMSILGNQDDPDRAINDHIVTTNNVK